MTKIRNVIIILSVLFLSACNNLMLPSSKSSPSTYVVVQNGETIESLAARINVPVEVIASANNLSRPYTLVGGQYLNIPRGYSNAAANSASSFVASNTDDDDLPTARDQYNASQNVVVDTPKYSTQSVAKRAEELPVTTIGSNNTSSRPASNVSTSSKPPAKPTPPAKPKETTQPKPVAPKSNTYIKPVNGNVVGSGGSNKRITYQTSNNTPVKAVNSGTVKTAMSNYPGYGNVVIIEHDDGIMSIYGNNSSTDVKAGDRVQKGQVISRVGNTSDEKTPMLIFEMKKQQGGSYVPVDPKQYIP